MTTKRPLVRDLVSSLASLETPLCISTPLLSLARPRVTTSQLSRVSDKAETSVILLVSPVSSDTLISRLSLSPVTTPSSKSILHLPLEATQSGHLPTKPTLVFLPISQSFLKARKHSMKPHSSAKPLSSMVLNFERASEVHLLTKVLLCLPSTLSFALTL